MINDTCLKISTHPDVEDLSFTDVNADKLLSLASSCLEENAPSLRTNDSLSNSGETVHETDVCTQETEIKSLHTEKKTDQLNANKFLSKALGKVPCMKRRDVIDLATDEEKRSPNDRWFLNKFGSSGVNRCRKKWISTRDQSISQRTLMQVSLKTKLEEKRRCEQQKRQVVYDADNCEVISENTCGILDYDSKSSESETSEKEELNYIAKQDETASSNYIYGKKIDNVCLLTQKMQVHHIFQVDNVSDEKLLEDNEEKSNFGICTFRGRFSEIGSSDDMSSLGLGDNILVDTVAGSCDFHVHDYAARKLDASVKYDYWIKNKDFGVRCKTPEWESMMISATTNMWKNSFQLEPKDFMAIATISTVTNQIRNSQATCMLEKTVPAKGRARTSTS
ncbi:unnamed protein product [Thelazia callipaeda]|uniref:Myb-like domain-containing protein n=1 Tax=Thelazia callipaeda TaxID=103827 RepID=A0A158RBW6_THECL|nr:unnamed protein product [Thelazia callipaeda]